MPLQGFQGFGGRFAGFVVKGRWLIVPGFGLDHVRVLARFFRRLSHSDSMEGCRRVSALPLWMGFRVQGFRV